jgi:hypothetical protein
MWLILVALHQLADGAVHRDGVGDRRDGADGVAAVALRAVEPAHPWAADVALGLVMPLAVAAATTASFKAFNNTKRFSIGRPEMNVISSRIRSSE